VRSLTLSQAISLVAAGPLLGLFTRFVVVRNNNVPVISGGSAAPLILFLLFSLATLLVLIGGTVLTFSALFRGWSVGGIGAAISALALVTVVAAWWGTGRIYKYQPEHTVLDFVGPEREPTVVTVPASSLQPLLIVAAVLAVCWLVELLRRGATES
jgi:hypothetical protein